jgi:hypothetical protein
MVVCQGCSRCRCSEHAYDKQCRNYFFASHDEVRLNFRHQ